MTLFGRIPQTCAQRRQEAAHPQLSAAGELAVIPGGKIHESHMVAVQFKEALPEGTLSHYVIPY